MNDRHYWDVNYINDDPRHAGGLVVEGETKEKAEEIARKAILQRYENDTIETITVEPSKITRKQRREFERKYGNQNT